MQVLFSEAESDLLCPGRGSQLLQVSQGECRGVLGVQTQDHRGPHIFKQEILSPGMLQVLCVWGDSQRKIPHLQGSANM